jgi:hypothetical protein
MRAVPRNAQTLGPWVPIRGRDEEVFTTLTNKSYVQNAVKADSFPPMSGGWTNVSDRRWATAIRR